MTAATLQPVRVWDLPLRLFHWALVLCVIGSIVTANLPGDWLDWHVRFGLAILALLLFRLAWGLVGGHWARFVTFLPRPRALAAYLRRDPRAHVAGHNPLGALSVFAMLLALALQVGTGLVSDNEQGFVAPLNHLVSEASGLRAMAWHKGAGKFVVLALILVHLVAVFAYLLVRRRNLIRPMIGGDQLLPASVPPSRDDGRTRVMAAVLIVMCGWIAWALAR